MPTEVLCSCGASYNLKDEFAGKTVACPQCSAHVEVPPLENACVDSTFKRDKFLLRQKHLSLSEKYYVWDEQGQTILFVERPGHIFRNLLAIFAGIFCGIALLVVGLALASLCESELGQGFWSLSGVLLGLVSCVTLVVLLYKKRHIHFYKDDTKKEPLLHTHQNKKLEFITATFTLMEENGAVLAHFKKNYLYDIFRKQWTCHKPDGSVLCTAKEDSILLSLLRRFLGPLFGILRTNFIVVEGLGDRVLGEFNRKFTLLDRYVLDMSQDPQNLVDRRIAIALGVLLDTGERR